MVPSSSSTATTSKRSPPVSRYQLPISGCGIAMTDILPDRCCTCGRCCTSCATLSRRGGEEMLEQLLKFFVVFFVVVEPVSLIPIFSGLTEGASRAYKHKMALKAVFVAGLILVVFALGGAGFLKLMGIS